MCLITTKRKVKIARTDIKVWKLVRTDYTSLFQEFQYEKDKLNKTIITLLGPNNIWSAFDSVDVRWLNEHHPYWTNIVYDDMKDKSEKLICINRGFHATLTKKRLGSIDYIKRNGIAVKCTIPAGAEYYKDETNCIVSNQIIVH